MKNRLKKKNVAREVWEQDIFDTYLQEMDELIHKYPEDPNLSNIDEQKLNDLIKELDTSWMGFWKKWHDKLTEAEKVNAYGKVSKNKDGLRHLIIKSGVNGENIFDLSVEDSKKIK